MPLLLSCRGLLDTRHDAAVPATVRLHAHLARYAVQFPEFDESAHTMVLLGRGCGEAMAAQLLSSREPYQYSTPLGKALVGSVCLNEKDSSHIGFKQTKHCNTLCTGVFKSSPSTGKNPSNVINDPSNVINDPCFHTLCTPVGPRLTPPIYVEH